MTLEDRLQALIQEYGLEAVRCAADTILHVGHVSFVSFSGRYPRLCGGILVLRIDGVAYRFGWDETCQFRPFWRSGGYIRHGTWRYSAAGPWIVDADLLPTQFKAYANEIARAMNAHMKLGCCGGCLDEQEEQEK